MGKLQKCDRCGKDMIKGSIDGIHLCTDREGKEYDYCIECWGKINEFKIFHAISTRLRNAEEEFEKQKRAKNLGPLEFASTKARYDTLREVYNLMYLKQ